MRQEFEVIVVGAGIIGLTAALAMAQRGFAVAVIDAGSMTNNASTCDPRVYAINRASQNLLKQLSLWQTLDFTRLSPYQRMYVWDQANGAHIQFDATSVAAQNLGYIIEECVLKEALLQQIKWQGITCFPNSSVSLIEPLQAGLRLASAASTWRADLVMIADGANSGCRRLLNVPLTTWPYHQQAIVALVKVEKAHQRTAYQLFNPDGPLAFLPLRDENLCSIVWSTSPARAHHLMALSEEKFNQELTTAFAKKLGTACLQSGRQQFPLVMRHTKQYTGNAWLLLGDAAHTIHPLAGLGLNLGLADIITWLACLDAGRKNLAAKKSLSAYHRQRKYEVWKTIALMEGLKTVFSNPLLTTVRGMGLQACNTISALKRLFIEEASGCKEDYFLRQDL